jgi:hypothetical protein
VAQINLSSIIVGTVTGPTGATGPIGATGAGVAGATGPSGSMPYVDATGTPDVIVATYSPAITSLTDGLTISFGAKDYNTLANPTLNVNSLGAKTIVKQIYGNTYQVLVAGDTGGNNYVNIVSYNSGNSQWILTNPAMQTLPYYANGSIIVPPANTVVIFGRNVANRMLPAWAGPSGLDSAVQPWLARNKVGYWDPPGNATTTPGVFGFTAPSTQGTATARNVATTNPLTRMRRLGYVSTGGGAGQSASNYLAVAQFATGDGFGNGGFTCIIRFGISDASAVASARAFIGMSANVAAAANVEANTIINQVGIMQLANDTTQWYSTINGSTVQPIVALGAALGSPSNTQVGMEVAIFSPPNANSVINMQVTNLGTGNTVFIQQATSVGGATPLWSVLLAPRMWRNNNVTASAVGLDVCSMYIETDQ